MKKGVWQHLKKSGEVIYVDVTWHSIHYKDLPAVLVLANDVTERIVLENELSEQRLSKQKQITEAVLNAQEKGQRSARSCMIMSTRSWAPAIYISIRR